MVSNYGILDCIAFHDDAVAVATAGRTGGTALTAALIKDDDGIVDEDQQGNIPILRDVLMGEFDVATDELVNNGWWSLQPNKWPNTQRLTGYTDHYAAEITDSGAATQHPSMKRQTIVTGKFNVQLTKGMDWISTNSKVAASIANADVALILVYQYGTAYPYQGGRLHRIMKVADAAMAAADVFDEAWSAQLTGTSPGLDETKNYILRGVIFEPAAKDKLSALVRVGTQKGPYKAIGFGNGNMLSSHETLFLHDGIPVHGTTGFVAEHLGGVTDTPWAGLVFEEYGGGGGGGFSGGGVITTPAPYSQVEMAPWAGASRTEMSKEMQANWAKWFQNLV